MLLIAIQFDFWRQASFSVFSEHTRFALGEKVIFLANSNWSSLFRLWINARVIGLPTFGESLRRGDILRKIERSTWVNIKIFLLYYTSDLSHLGRVGQNIPPFWVANVANVANLSAVFCVGELNRMTTTKQILDHIGINFSNKRTWKKVVGGKRYINKSVSPVCLYLTVCGGNFDDCFLFCFTASSFF